MNDGVIHKIIQRANLNILIASLLGFVLIAAAAILNLNYLMNFISGPVNVDITALTGATSAAAFQRYWVNVTGDDLVDTGIQYISTSGSTETVEASYMALLIGQRVLIVRMEGEQTAEKLPLTQTGWLSDLTSEEDAEIIQKSVAETPELQGVILPFKLDTSNFRTNGYIGLGAAAVIFLLSAWGMITVLRRTNDPDSHPILKKLARFGPLDFIMPRIEAELSGPHPVIGKLHLTNNWLVYTESANLMATRIEDVAWIYKHVLTRKSYGITVGKTFTVMTYDRFGVQLNFLAGSKEPACDEMLVTILGRAPWAVAGYSKELEQAWKKDRPAFLAAVERRKAAAASQPA